MPYKRVYVLPRKYMEFEGRYIYHTYRDNNWEDELPWLFTTNVEADCHVPTEYEFNVLGLQVENDRTVQRLGIPGVGSEREMLFKGYDGKTLVKALIVAALKQGMISFPPIWKE